MAAPSPFEVAADLLDPPAWHPADREPPLPHQQPPDGRWTAWFLEGGRGCGKTEACARYFAKWMREHPGHRGRIIAPTFGDAVESCIAGPSGLRSVDPDVTWQPNAPGGAKVTWPNGSEALVLGTHTPIDVDRLRAGGNRHIDWWEEIAANRQLGGKGSEGGAWEQAQLGLRLGDWPHSIGSTTPRATRAWKTIRAGDGVRLTRATMHDNPHVPEAWKAEMERLYAGTRLYRQEVLGELLEDVEGALWTAPLLDLGRMPDDLSALPDMTHVVVAIDPAVTATMESDWTGIVVAAKGIDGKGYVLADLTCKLSPAGWASRVIEAYDRWQADVVVAEVNNGGDLVEAALVAECERQRRAALPYEAVRASRGKQTRAQPVANLYGDPDDLEASIPRVHHVGELPELEDQLTSWNPDDGASPDRLDALVWALTWLLLVPDDPGEVVYEDRVEISPY